MASQLLALHDRLLAHFGPQGWWPGETPFEVMVGAVLTQNTSWANVSRAIAALRDHDLLSLPALAAMPVAELAGWIRPAGYFNQKALRLKGLIAAINQEYGGDLAALFATGTPELRAWLLARKGIGPETADSILLYAAGKPVFVVDAYTHRILSRHRLTPEESSYHELQELFMDGLPEDVALFNEFHALLVACGKDFCRKSRPRCDGCPLQGWPE
ncbi:MAG: endonuclease III domain-containing protein [Thermodesulfobacteriota bacterium]